MHHATLPWHLAPPPPPPLKPSPPSKTLGPSQKHCRYSVLTPARSLSSSSLPYWSPNSRRKNEEEVIQEDSTMHALWKALLAISASIFPIRKAIAGGGARKKREVVEGGDKFLSWRLAVETNNMLPWRRIPAWCVDHLEQYMIGGQYDCDMEMIVDQILAYVDTISPAGDGMDVWIFDVDDTCLSNIPYFDQTKWGIVPFIAMEYNEWVHKGVCPAIAAVLKLFNKLIESGFKIILITSRDEEEHGPATLRNLKEQGLIGYEKIIMRTPAYKVHSSLNYKEDMRKLLVAEGYRIRGNVGDQWTDLAGECVGERGFKVPNPMYFIA